MSPKNDGLMSTGELKKSKEGSNSPSGSYGYYVYCICEKLPAEKLTHEPLPAAIDEKAKLEVIMREDLAGIVSAVPLSVFGEDALQEHLTDAAWTAVKAMRHEQVVEHFAKQTSVVPLRFGTIYLERSGIEEMLDEKREQLVAILKRLQGHEEWGVNVYSDRDALLENITTVSPRLREMSEAAKKAPPGQSYLLQKKIDALRTDEVKVEVVRIADEIEKSLHDRSDGSVKLKILKVETTEHGELKAKFAFLVNKEKFAAFRDGAEELARRFEDSGIKIELTGPWPAYNFATL